MASNVIEMPLDGYDGVPLAGYEHGHDTYQTSASTARIESEIFMPALSWFRLVEPPRNCKWCPSCGEWKDRHSEWHRNSARPDGLQTICRECKNAEERRRYRRSRAA